MVVLKKPVKSERAAQPKNIKTKTTIEISSNIGFPGFFTKKRRSSVNWNLPLRLGLFDAV